MARTTDLPHATYIDGLRRAQAMGFDMSKAVKVKHDASYEDLEPEPEPGP